MRSSNLLALLAVGLLALTGCAPTLSRPSQSSKDLSDNQTKPSKHQPEHQHSHKASAKAETNYVPVPLPGQLMPVPTTNKHKAHKFKTKQEAVLAANKNAQLTPKSSDFFNSMMVYSFTPGSLYTIYTAPMHITDVMFAPGEQIISEAAGDTLRWQVGQTYSGSGANSRQHLLFKPSKPGLNNTVVVTTNERVYHLILQSNDSNAYMASVKWHYPQTMVTKFQQKTATASKTSSPKFDLNLANLNFDYKFGVIKGSKPSWYPLRVFANDRQTFIQFPKGFDNDNTPILYIKNDNGDYSPMNNWHMKGHFLIVDRVIAKARLQTGVSKTGQTIVQIQQG